MDDPFPAEQPLCPRPVRLGKTVNGTPRLRYVKWKIIAFIDLLSGAGEDYGDAAPDASTDGAEEQPQPPRNRAKKPPG